MEQPLLMRQHHFLMRQHHLFIRQLMEINFYVIAEVTKRVDSFNCLFDMFIEKITFSVIKIEYL